MSRRIHCRFAWLVPVTLVLALGPAARPLQLSEVERRGKGVYLRGVSDSSTQIQAQLEKSSTQVPATVLPCVSCHGHDGKGRREGGVTVPEITWNALTKPNTTGQRPRPAYTEQALRRAILQGLDPAGNVLLPAMPRYAMSHEDFAALVAYLKHLGMERDPGLTETTIRIGMVLPPDAGAAMAEIRSMVESYLETINRQGGIYGRRLLLSVVNFPATAGDVQGAGERAADLAREDVFALLAPYAGGAEARLVRAAEQSQIPLFTPFASTAAELPADSRYTFYLFSGLREQALVLLDYATKHLRGGQPVLRLVRAPDGAMARVAEEIERHARAQGWEKVEQSIYAGEAPPTTPTAGEAGSPGVVTLFLGSAERATGFVRSRLQAGAETCVLLPGSIVSREMFELPATGNVRLYAAFPILPSNQNSGALAQIGALIRNPELRRRPPSALLWTFVAARVLVEGLRMAGRNVSREKLISALEGLYDFETGVTPRITYGPSRRTGSLGAYVLEIELKEKKFVRVSDWITPGI
jgi:ABC-type branched-subunit amino acid transport system substrate-binding protein